MAREEGGKVDIVICEGDSLRFRQMNGRGIAEERRGEARAGVGGGVERALSQAGEASFEGEGERASIPRIEANCI